MSNPSSRFSLLGLSALGIVFGDIGTSPLYAYKTVLILAGGADTPGLNGHLRRSASSQVT